MVNARTAVAENRALLRPGDMALFLNFRAYIGVCRRKPDMAIKRTL